MSLSILAEERVPPAEDALTFDRDEKLDIYRALLGDKCVAQLQVWHHDGDLAIGRVYVARGFRRKGYLTALYAHVEQTRQPGGLTRLPNDAYQEPWMDIDIPELPLDNLEFAEAEHEDFLAVIDGYIVARAQVWRHPDNRALSTYRFFTHPYYQRMGVMAQMYKHIEEKYGQPLIPMPLHVRTEAGVAFRKKYEAAR